jgi:hypothetical protein
MASWQFKECKFLSSKSNTFLISSTFSWLGKLHVFLQGHQSSQIIQQVLDGEITFPFSENRHMSAFNLRKFYNLRIDFVWTNQKWHTIPLVLTQFMFIFVINLAVGGCSGYDGPHSILRLYILFA